MMTESGGWAFPGGGIDSQDATTKNALRSERQRALKSAEMAQCRPLSVSESGGGDIVGCLREHSFRLDVRAEVISLRSSACSVWGRKRYDSHSLTACTAPVGFGNRLLRGLPAVCQMHLLH